MKHASNSFTGGLVLDMHPLTTLNTQFTDALNATLVTFNGNEMMLQNDMGNTRIQDSKTGHIMGLSEGFIPVGLKEHGGIMYIVSANKEGLGEIGTIPSPILKVSLNKVSMSMVSKPLVNSEGPISNPCIITDFKLYPGEKYLPIFNINYKYDESEKFMVYKMNHQTPENYLTGRMLLSSILESTPEDVGGPLHNGLYELKLFAINDSNLLEITNVYKKPLRPYLSNGDRITDNPFWFLVDDSNSLEIDVEKTWLSGGFHSYPGNFLPGKLAIQATLESINYFDLPLIRLHKDSKLQKTKAPYILKEPNGYVLYFLGFVYKTKSSRFINKIEVVLENINNTTQVDLKIKDESNIEKTVDTLFNALEFSTVDIGEVPCTEYQIQKLSKNKTYKKIEAEDVEIESMSFDPIFYANIGTNLNAWYKLTVHYYDTYGGYIDTFSFSFNPFTILNYEESYYNLIWKNFNFIPQKFNCSDANDKSQTITTQLTKTLQNVPSAKAKGHHSGGRTATPISEGSFYLVNGTVRDEWIVEPQETTLFTHEFKVGGYKYLYVPSQINLSWKYKNFNLLWVWSNPAGNLLYFDPEAASGSFYGIKEVVDAGDDNSTNWLNNIVPSVGGSYSFQMPPDEYGNSETKDYVYKFDLDDTETRSKTISQFEDIHWNGEDDVCIKLMGVEQDFPSWSFVCDSMFVDSIYDFELDKYIDSKTKESDIPISISHHNGGDPSTMPAMIIDPISVPNLSCYAISPGFSLYGDTDEGSNLLLGFDRSGQLNKVNILGKNLYPFSHKETSNQNSTLVRDIMYYPSTDNTDETGIFILPKGTYLVTFDAGIKNKTSYTNIVINGINYKLPRIIDTDANVYHAPALVYLPINSKVQIRWRNLRLLQLIGVYQINTSIFMLDKTDFASGSDPKIIYYQDPSLLKGRDIILPIEATYNESAKCFNKNFTYYFGTSQPYVCNRHVIADSGLLQRQTNGDYSYGEQIMSFVYEYSESYPFDANVPLISGITNTLTYRQLIN